jgi:hypothetical protein
MAHTEPSGPDKRSHASPGGEVHGGGVRPEAVVVNHETSDIPLGGTARAALFTVVGIGLVMLLMWGAWGFFLAQARAGDPGRPAMSADDFGQRIPATPRLQSLPGDDLASYRAQQTAKIDGLAWVDQGAGTVRIPIQAAMQLIVQRADSFADPQAKAPADHSWSFPGASMPAEAAAAPAAPMAPAPATVPPPAHGGGH